MREALPWLVAALPAAPAASLFAGGRSRLLSIVACGAALAVASSLLAGLGQSPGVVEFDWSRVSSLLKFKTGIDRIGATMAVALSAVALIASIFGTTAFGRAGDGPRLLSLSAALVGCTAVDALTLAALLFIAAAAESLIPSRDGPRWFAWQCTAAGLLAGAVLAAQMVADGRLTWTLPGRWTFAVPVLSSALWIAGLALRSCRPAAKSIGDSADDIWLITGSLLLGQLAAVRLGSELLGPRERSLVLAALGLVAMIQAAAAAFGRDRTGAIQNALCAQGTIAVLLLIRSAPGSSAAAIVHLLASCLCGMLLMGMTGRWTRSVAGLGLGGLPLFGVYWTLSQLFSDLDVWAAGESGIRRWLAWSALGAVATSGLLLSMFGGKCIGDHAAVSSSKGGDAATALVVALLLLACAGSQLGDSASGWLETGRLTFRLPGFVEAGHIGEPAAAGFLGRNVWLLVAAAASLCGGGLSLAGWNSSVAWRSDTGRSKGLLELAGAPFRWLDASLIEAAIGKAAGSMLARPVRLRRGEALPWTSPLTLLVCLVVMLSMVLAVRWR